ncbi:hypothetical protein HMPREF1982_01304 [Clostridiales bacterium oral taxon 876 str. F0540]|nr:hypothetical protein HMPREF1982_01304 [Clostridiales bacterium oral taxon 876 str. F0540]
MIDKSFMYKVKQKYDIKKCIQQNIKFKPILYFFIVQTIF